MTGNTLKLLLSVATISLLAQAAHGAFAASADAARISRGFLARSPAGARAETIIRVAQDVTALASPYTWTARKAADGTVSLEGHVPSLETRQSLVDGIAKLGTDTTVVARGEPDGFVADAVAALDVLAVLDSGQASFDGSAWSVSGTVDSADKLKAANAAFDASPLKPLDAAYHVEGPAPSDTQAATSASPASAAPSTAPTASAPASTPAAAPAVAAPSPSYAWSAVKAADGTITFAGSVPNGKLQGFLANHVTGKAVDNSVVADGAPSSFVGGALYGLDALMLLQSGKLAFADGKWTLSGSAKDEATSKQAAAALSVIDTKQWTFDIAVAAAAAVKPAAEPAAPAAAAAAPAAQPATPAAAASVTTTAPAATTPATPASTPAPAEAKPAAPAPPAYDFMANKAVGGTVTLSGDVPTEGARGYFGDFAGGALTGGLTVVPNPPKDFVANTLGGLDALGKLDVGQLKFSAGKWSLHGKTGSPETRDAVLASLAKLPAGKDFSPADIVGPSPVELCRSKLGAFVAGGGRINFDGSTTRFVKGTDALLDQVAAALALCPDARVDVEGNTDSDGPADANMALSVARSEAVIGALVKRGIKLDRLYAVGYGETLPLVPNTTKANKAKNRRIEFKIEP